MPIKALIDFMRLAYSRKRLRRGFEMLERQDYDGAEKIARALVRARFPGGWELLATTYFDQEKIFHALQTLEDGTRAFPAVWSLWDLYGIYLSENGKYGEARAALENALRCPDVRRDRVCFDMAVVFSREKDYEDALELLDEVQAAAPTPDDRIRYKLFALDLMAEVREPAAVKDFAETMLREIEALPHLESPVELAAGRRGALSSIAYHLARIALDRGDLDEANARAKEAVGIDPQNERALGLLRQARGLRSENSRYFNVLVEGQVAFTTENGDKAHRREALPFFRNFRVIAESLEECRAYIEEFEAFDRAKVLKIVEHSAAEPVPGDFKGVCWVSGRAFSDNGAAEKQ